MLAVAKYLGFEWPPNLVKPPLERLSADFETDSELAIIGKQYSGGFSNGCGGLTADP